MSGEPDSEMPGSNERQAEGEARIAAPDAGAFPDASLLTLLEAFGTGSADPGKVLLGALASQAGNSPPLDMFMRLAGDADKDASARTREEIREEVRAEQAEAVNELSETVQRLFEEIKAARHRLEALGAALGACPVCFGEDLLCDTCHGAGRPGARAPDPDEFRRYVCPAIDRVRTALRRAATRRPRDPSSIATYPSFDRAAKGA